MYTLIECSKHLAFHLFLHSIFEAYACKEHAVFQISFVCRRCTRRFIYVPTKRNSSNDFRSRQTEEDFDLCARFLAHRLVLRALSFSPVAHHRAGLPNTIGLFSSTNAERFPALPSRPTSSGVELRGCVPSLHTSYSALFLTYLAFS